MQTIFKIKMMKLFHAVQRHCSRKKSLCWLEMGTGALFKTNKKKQKHKQTSSFLHWMLLHVSGAANRVFSAFFHQHRKVVAS